jgi:imidazolonepropionase-like amidohydrolase
MNRFIFWPFILSAFMCNLWAAELLVKGARLYTLTDAGIIEDGDIYIRDGIIENIGIGLQAGESVRVIDAAGKQVTPGLINASSQLGLVEISAVSDSVDVETEDMHYSASFTITPAINPSSSAIPHNRIHGLTHAVLAPSFGHHVFAGQGAVIRLDMSSSVINGSVAVYARFDSTAGEFAGGSRAAAFTKIRQAFLDTREFSDNRDAVRRGEWREFSLPINDLEALVPVVFNIKPLVVTSHRASDIRTLIGLKNEFGLKMIIAGATEAWMLADELSVAGIPVIMDPMANLPRNFDRLGARLDAAARLQAAGVKVLFTDYVTSSPLSPYLVRQSAGNAAAYGMDRIEAIKAMTIYPAEVFGFAGRYGSIEEGKVADLVIWNGDPLEIMTGADVVLMNGEVIPMVSRSTRLRDRYRDLDSDVPFIFRK